MSLNTDQSRILYGSPLTRPRFAKLAASVLAVVTALCASVVFRAFQKQITNPDALRVFLIALLWSGLFTVGTIAILRFIDRREPESGWLYLVTFLWGAFIAAGVAIPINTAIFGAVDAYMNAHPDVQAYLGANATYMIGAPIAGPLVEEITKGIGVLLLFFWLRSEFDNVRDGLIYGALIGAGFNFLESAMYVVNTYAQWGIAPWALHIGLRHAIFGLTGHAMYTGLFGAFLGLSRQTARTWLRYTAPVVGWLLGYSAHFANNITGLLTVLGDRAAGEAVEMTPQPPPGLELTPGTPFVATWLFFSVFQLFRFLPFVLIVGVMLWQSGGWERQVIRDELADESDVVITPAEYEAVKSDRLLKTRRIDNTDRQTSAAIVKAQNELAFRKWRLKHDGKSVESDPLVNSWRGELARLRDRAEVSVGAAPIAPK